VKYEACYTLHEDSPPASELELFALAAEMTIDKAREVMKLADGDVLAALSRLPVRRVLRVRRRLAVLLGAKMMKAGPVAVSSAADAYGLVQDIARAEREHLVGIYLDAQNNFVCRKTLSVGTLNTTRTHPREVLLPAIVNHAMGFILAHNHPSGSLTASRDDINFTKAMRKAGELIGIDLYDHLILSRDGFTSLRERDSGLFRDAS